MTLEIGKKIKECRTARGLSQETFAEFLQVSPADVEKWENEEEYPSLELIRSIAHCLNTTTDDLLGMEELQRETKIREYLDEFQNNIQTSNLSACIEGMREGLKYFPNNYKFMYLLMYSLYLCCSRRSEINYYTAEIVSLGNYILANCTDDSIRMDAKHLLCLHYYGDLDDSQKAKEIAQTLPSRTLSKEEVLPTITDGNTKLYWLQENIRTYVDSLTAAIHTYAMNNEALSNAERIAFYELSNQLITIVYTEKDYNALYLELMYSYKTLAVLHISDNHTEEALDCLEQAALCAIRYDALPLVTAYSSPLLNRLSYDREQVDLDDPRPKRKIFMEDFIKMDCFSTLRYHERIRKISNLLNS